MSTVDPGDIFGYFQSLGYPAESAAAITGNAFGESSYNMNALGDNGNSYGLWQFGPGNQQAFQSQFGFPIQQASWQQQASFVNTQLQSSYPSTYNTLMQGGTVGNMTQAFEAGFERPASLSDVGSRAAAAAKVLGGGASSAVTSALTSALNLAVPGSGTLLGLAGIGGGPSLLQQFETWIANSHFWQRLALGVLALICLGGAIFLLANKSTVVNNAIKAAVKP